MNLQIQNAAGNTAEITRITREFCSSTCVTQTIPACSSLDPSVQAAVNQLMQRMYTIVLAIAN